MHKFAPPEELLKELREGFPGLFQPEELLTTEDALIGYLELLVPEYRSWGDDPKSSSFGVLLREIESGEALVSVIERYNLRYILRDIRTTTLYVTATRPSLPGQPGHNWASTRKMWLKERKLIEGEMVPRKHPNSMSEKLRRGELTHRDIIPRMIKEELGIQVRPEYLELPHLFQAAEVGIKEFRPPEARLYLEKDVHPSEKFPGILTRNQLVHFQWHMPEEYFVESGYHEENTNHYFFWEEVTQNQM